MTVVRQIAKQAMTSGIALRVLATFLMAAMSASVHAAAKEATLGQIVFYRSTFALVPIVLYALWLAPGIRSLQSQNPMLHVTRGVIGCATMFLSFASLAYLPVANAIALAYLVPVVSLPLAGRFLRERIGFKLVVAVLLGLAGVIVMLFPALVAPDLNREVLIGTAAGLGYALTMGFVKVHIKSMTKTETPVSIAFYFALICGLLGGVTYFWGWPVVTGSALIGLVGAGILGGLAHIASTEAVARAPLSVLAPFEYTGMIWALMFDIVVFSQIPNGFSLTGCILILLAAVIVVFGDKIIALPERKRSKNEV